MLASEYIPGIRSFDTMKDVLDYAIEEATVTGTNRGQVQGEEQERIRVIQAMLTHDCKWAFIEKITGCDQAKYLALVNKY